MKKVLLLFVVIFSANLAFAQERFELTPNGFPPIEIEKPRKPLEKLMDASKAWVDSYHKGERDVYNVTATSLQIDAVKQNAFFYRNLGETFQHRIKYTLKVEFLENTYRLTFVVKEIYTKQTLLKMTVSDFFTPDGKLKDDFEEAKPSLEQTANKVLKSFTNFIQTY